MQECETYEESQTINNVATKVVKTRTVTKKKTKTYQKVVPETRWRDVPRSFEYQALQVERTQSYAVRAELLVAGQSAAAAGRDAADSHSGYSHDVVFEAAGVQPSRQAPGRRKYFNNAFVGQQATRGEFVTQAVRKRFAQTLQRCRGQFFGK